MRDDNQNRKWPAAEPDALDRELNAALAKSVAAEPRPGLEERILAHLRTARDTVPARAVWPWRTAAGLAAVVVVVALARRIENSTPPVTATHAPAAARNGGDRDGQISDGRNYNSQDGNGQNRDRENNHQPHTRIPTRAARHSPREIAGSAGPKLDQFPSSQPLTAEELALARYVSQFPKEATLIARAQEEYEKEIQKQMKDTNAETEDYGSGQQER